MATQVDYDTHGKGYARRRLADPRFAERIESALGDARTVLNVGAGAGSYEPRDRWVLAVEPSATMRAQRLADAARASLAPPNRCRSTTTRSTRPWPASRSTIGPTARRASPSCAASPAAVWSSSPSN